MAPACPHSGLEGPGDARPASGGAERRRHRRYHVVCRLEYTIPSRGPQEVRRGITGNLGIGGVLARLPEVLEPGTVLILNLKLPSGRVHAEATVVRVEEPGAAGPPLEPITDHGLQFSRIAPPSTISLEQFLETLEDATKPLLEP